MAGLWQRVTTAARALRRDVVTLWVACRTPGTPLGARLLGLLIVAYAVSPIDLIPDFIPVLGLLDELLLLTGLVWLALKALPAARVAQFRAAAEHRLAAPPTTLRLAGVFIVLLVWSALAAWAWARWVG
jgi:uncharacterized membrane protein YkvA (DUF1232 family)